MAYKAKLNTFNEIFGFLKLLGYHSIYDEGYQQKPATGVTFRLRKCYKISRRGNERHAEFIGLPQFDCSERFNPNDLKVITQYARKKIVDSDFNVVDDLYFDVAEYLFNGQERWSKFSELTNSCGVCMGLLSTPVNIDGYPLYASRPTSVQKVAFGYTSYNDFSNSDEHLVYWSTNHNEQAERIHLQSYVGGFRHISQMYSHNHYHYIKRMEVEPREGLKYKRTTLFGEYVTYCLLETLAKTSDKVACIRSLAGILPFGIGYDELISEQDREHYKILCLMIVFGLGKISSKSNAAMKAKIEELTVALDFIDDAFWTRLFDGRFPLFGRHREYLERYYPEFLRNGNVYDAEADDIQIDFDLNDI